MRAGIVADEVGGMRGTENGRFVVGYASRNVKFTRNNVKFTRNNVKFTFLLVKSTFGSVGT
jgi:hypothetical protein